MTDTLKTVPTGFPRLDAMLDGGLKPGTLTILAARSGDGTSTFAYTVLRNATINHGLSAYLASTQSSGDMVTAKILGAEADVDTSRIHGGKVDDEERARLEAQRGKVSAMPLAIDDAPYMSLTHVRVALRQIRNRIGLDFAVIDSTGAIDVGPDTPICTDEWVKEIAPGLKELARMFRIPVLATVHMRWPHDGSDRPPTLEDMPEGGFETVADTVLTLNVADRTDQLRNACGRWDVTVAVEKNRRGRLGSLQLVHEGPYSRFRDLESECGS